MKSRFHRFGLFLFFLAFVSLLAYDPASAAQTKSVNVTGKWQISWEARLGTEHDMIELKQVGSTLTGSFHGRLGSPKVSGHVDGKNVTLRLDFPGKQPYSLVFTGAIDTGAIDTGTIDTGAINTGTIGGDKMSGKFEIPGVRGAYDFHGENVRASNYTWSAVRVSEPSHASASSQYFDHAL
jgi:hypothetical protein